MGKDAPLRAAVCACRRGEGCGLPVSSRGWSRAVTFHFLAAGCVERCVQNHLPTLTPSPLDPSLSTFTSHHPSPHPARKGKGAGMGDGVVWMGG